MKSLRHVFHFKKITHISPQIRALQFMSCNEGISSLHSREIVLNILVRVRKEKMIKKEKKRGDGIIAVNSSEKNACTSFPHLERSPLFSVR